MVPPLVILDEKQSETLVLKVVSARAAHTYRSSVAQRQSIRLLTGGLLVRIQPEEPISLRKFSVPHSGVRAGRALCISVWVVGQFEGSFENGD